MDAIIQNKCEYELIGIIQELGNILKIELVIETEPIGEGGLRRWFKVITNQENKNASISTAVLVALLTLILITPLTEITEQIIEGWFEDKELNELEKEKLRLEIRKLKREEFDAMNEIDVNNLLKKKRSNFYERLEQYPKVDSVSYKNWDDKHQNETKDEIIPRNQFGHFVLSTDEISPIEDPNAIIEIISPVLKKGKYKWTGYYMGEPISFNMKSKEFRSLIQAGKVEFKNGSSIECNLLIKCKVNIEGIVIKYGYEVARVNRYFENDKPIETKEGRSYRINKENSTKSEQLDLFKLKQKE